MIHWVVGPVDVLEVEGRKFRVPRVSNLGFQHSSVVGDGDSCLSFIRGNPELLDRHCSLLFDDAYEDDRPILDRPIGEMAWSADRQLRLQSLLSSIGVDNAKHSPATRLSELIRDVGRKFNKDCGEPSSLYVAGPIPRSRDLPSDMGEDPGDTFVEASTVALTAHTPTGSGAGTGWTEEARTGTVIQRVNATTDNAEATTAEPNDYHVYSIQPNPSVAEYDLSMGLLTVSTITTSPFWLIARWASGPTCYGAGTYRSGDAADKKIYKNVSGTVTELASTDTGIATSDTLLFEVRDATKTLYKNGVSQINTSDNVITAAGRWGYALGNLFVAVDDIGSAWGFKPWSATEVAPTGGKPFLYYARQRGRQLR